MKKIQEFIYVNYGSRGLSSIEFLRDAMAYFNSRIEGRNEGKDIEQLLLEYLDLRKCVR